MKRRLLLYTRRDNVIRGPFPSKQISRHLLLGRISEDDEVSTDQVNWRQVRDFPELIPNELKGDMDDPLVQQRLRLARFREDERLAGDRRGNRRQKAGDENRKPGDRRTPETVATRKHREIKTEILREGKQSSNTKVISAVIVVMAIVGIIGYMVKQVSPKVTFVKSCDVTARPGANWSDCQMEGAVYNQANLKNSRLRNVNLTGSELTNSDFSGSDLAYGNYSLASFKYSNLRDVNMLGAVLRKANLSNTSLLNTTLSFAVLQDANLSYANLQNADLSNADLSGAIITGANLNNVKLDNAIWIDQRICGLGSRGKCNFREKK